MGRPETRTWEALAALCNHFPLSGMPSSALYTDPFQLLVLSELCFRLLQHHTPHQVLNIHPPIRPPTHLPRHLIYLPYYLFILFIYSVIYSAIHLSNLLSIIYSLSQLPIIYLYLPIHSFILPIHLPWSIYVSVHLPTLTIISFIYPSVHLSIHSPTIHQSIHPFICSSDLSTVHQSIHLSTHSVNMH